MPRYFFHVHDGVLLRDDVGTELPDIYAARTHAVQLSGRHLADMGSQFWADLGAHLWDGTEWHLEVTDEQGERFFVLRFAAEEQRGASILAFPLHPKAPKH